MCCQRGTQAFVFAVLCAGLTIFILPARDVFAVTDDSISAKSDAQLENPANKIATPSVPETDKGLSEPATEAEQRDNALELKRRAGEQNPDDPRARASVLGMYLQESVDHYPIVVEVGAATPAFDAGVHEGDKILSYQGFTGDTYRKWIDGIRKLTTDAPADSRLPLIVLRDGNRMALRIRVPERAVRTDTSRALAQRLQSQTAPGQNVPLPAGPTGGGNALIGNAGPFGDFFGGDNVASSSDAAMAEIVRLNVPSGTAGIGPQAPVGGSTPRTANRAGEANALPGSGARIGVAGFRDDPSGMVVMIDVGALPPGNYSVGISDASVMAGTNARNTGVTNPAVNSNRGGAQAGEALAPPTPVAPPNPPKFRPHRSGTSVPQGAPGAAPAPPSAPAGGTSAPQGSLPMIPRTVLAQVASGNNATGTGAASSGTSAASGTRTTTPNTAPSTGQVKPIQEPPQSRVDPATGLPGAPSGVNNAVQHAGTNQTPTNGVGNTNRIQVGTLTVDQSGTGRLQTTVGGTQVRTVVGQAIVIYAPATGQTTLPPNLNVGAGAATRQGATNINSARSSQGVVAGAQDGANRRVGTAGPTSTGPGVPLAAGIIHLISDHRPPATGIETTGSTTGVNTGTGTTETATPETGQNKVVR
jgi:hypothetical protein